MVPLLIILFFGTIILLKNNPEDYTKRLYIKCNNVSKNFEVYSGVNLRFADNNEKCKLDIEVINVDSDYIKISTSYLWPVNFNGDIDKTAASQTNIISSNEETQFYSYDEQIKYIFTFK